MRVSAHDHIMWSRGYVYLQCWNEKQNYSQMKNQTLINRASLAFAACGILVSLLACHPEPKVAGEHSVNQDPTMRLWQVYDHCRKSTNLEERKGQALLLHHSVLLRTNDGATQLPRRSVNIEALAASCNLLAASAMVEAGEIQEASTVYYLALLHANTPDLASLRTRAQSALNELQTSPNGSR